MQNIKKKGKPRGRPFEAGYNQMNKYKQNKVVAQDLIKNEKKRENEQNKFYIKNKYERYLNSPLNNYIQYVIKTVCEEFKVSVEEIKGKSRKIEFVEARFIIAKILDNNTGLGPYCYIFLNKCRTTYYNAIEKVDDFLITSNQKARFAKLEEICSLNYFNKF